MWAPRQGLTSVGAGAFRLLLMTVTAITVLAPLLTIVAVQASPLRTHE